MFDKRKMNWLQEWTVPRAITVKRLDAESQELASVTSVMCVSLLREMTQPLRTRPTRLTGSLIPLTFKVISLMVTSSVKKKRGRTTQNRTWLSQLSATTWGKLCLPDNGFWRGNWCTQALPREPLALPHRSRASYCIPTWRTGERESASPPTLGVDSKIRRGIRLKPISNKLHTLTLSPSEKKGLREGAIRGESESRIKDKIGPCLAVDSPSWRLDSSSFKTTISFFESSLFCYLLFSPT